MAGADRAKKMMVDGKDTGKALGLGRTIYKSKYMLVELDNDQGISLEIDYGSDIGVSDRIKPGDRVKLIKHDGYTYEWVKE